MTNNELFINATRANYQFPFRGMINQIYVDPLTNEYYLDIETSEWDEYDDGFVHQREYIAYCPYCGRKLGDELRDIMTQGIEKYCN